MKDTIIIYSLLVTLGLGIYAGAYDLGFVDGQRSAGIIRRSF